MSKRWVGAMPTWRTSNVATRNAEGTPKKGLLIKKKTSSRSLAPGEGVGGHLQVPAEECRRRQALAVRHDFNNYDKLGRRDG